MVQEKVYLFVVATLQHTGASAVHNADDAVFVAELLVPTVCVSKRNRGAGTIDYVAQAVSKLSYNWNDVSKAGLY